MKPKSKRPLLLSEGGNKWEMIVHDQHLFLNLRNGGKDVMKNGERDELTKIEMKGEIENRIISKEDLKMYFNNRKFITKSELENYYKNKHKI